MTTLQVGAVVVAYLIGSISFARVVAARRLPDEDITTTDFPVEGSDETWTYTGVSATSVLHRAGAIWGVAVIVLDVAKALVPTLAARLYWPDEAVYLAVALAVFIGHIWPVWHRFRGGRGQAVILGAMLVIDPLAIPVAIFIGAIVGIVVFTSVHVARNSGPLFAWTWFAATDGWGSSETLFGLVLAMVYLVALWPDLTEERRVRAALGTSQLSWRKRFAESLRGFFSTED